METVYLDYSPKGVQFYYVYKRLAHPEFNGYVDPYTLEERLMHVREAERSLGSDIPWLADTMTSDLKQALGGHPNAEYVIDPDGIVLAAREWSDPEALRRDLAEAVGAVEPATRAEDLDMPAAPPETIAPSGVVERLSKPGGMRVVHVTAGASEEAHYVKLRAQATSDLIETGTGKLYLGFFVDPIHRVHWNNLVDPVRFEASAGEGVRITPANGAAPKVAEPSDVDPREFILDVAASAPGATLDVTVYYYGCSDEQGWCRAITQKYSITLTTDTDAGWVMGGSRRGPPAGFGPLAGMERGASDLARVVDLVFAADDDGDDRLSRAEAPFRLRAKFDAIDADGDGGIDRAEAEDHFRAANAEGAESRL